MGVVLCGYYRPGLRPAVSAPRDGRTDHTLVRPARRTTQAASTHNYTQQLAGIHHTLVRPAVSAHTLAPFCVCWRLLALVGPQLLQRRVTEACGHMPRAFDADLDVDSDVNSAYPCQIWATRPWRALLHDKHTHSLASLSGFDHLF